jgi:hypothetical protein
MIALCYPRFAPANVKLTSRRLLGQLIHIWESEKKIPRKAICKSFLHQGLKPAARKLQSGIARDLLLV